MKQPSRRFETVTSSSGVRMKRGNDEALQRQLTFERTTRWDAQMDAFRTRDVQLNNVEINHAAGIRTCDLEVDCTDQYLKTF
ncbi:hypothetical protein Csa_018515 [Cucumis sativus]|uniref:Uncharacterized protein n=1 Tax=Cucumis sativus TaxID=3659 RepID=A0A0A0KJ76_CUCSA|nr:hypothetical protein Csa_018515 [Cucumis sativus]